MYQRYCRYPEDGAHAGCTSTGRRNVKDAGKVDRETRCNKLGCAPSEFVRSKEDAYREAGLSKQSSDADLLRAMAAHPILVERPIVVNGARAAIGRPPEDVLEIL